jgi:hypothetical protein
MHAKRLEIDRQLLHGMSTARIAKDMDLNEKSVQAHRQKHLPWRPQNFRKAESVGDRLADLRFEAERLRALGECGVAVNQALGALREERALLELQARLGGMLDATHRKLLNNSKDPAGGTDYEVVFVGGRPRTVEKPA